MERVNFLLLIGFIIFFIVSIVFIFLYAKSKNDSVAPQNCPKVLSSYASIANVNPSSVRVQNLCASSLDGTPGLGPCNFSSINSLFEAEATCAKYTTGACEAFIYYPSTSTMTFINSSYTITPDGTNNSLNGDVYLKQINFKS